MIVLPIAEVIAVPDSRVHLRTDLYQSLAHTQPVEGDEVAIITPKHTLKVADATRDSFQPIAVQGHVQKVDGQGFLVIDVERRVQLDDARPASFDTIDIDATPLDDIDDLDKQSAESRIGAIKEELIEISQHFEWEPMMTMMITSWHTIGDIVASLSWWMEFDAEKRFSPLVESSTAKRFDILEAMLLEYIELTRVRIKVQTEEHKDHQKLYREQAIRSQMERFQKELDKMHPDQIDGVRKLELAIEESGMNETARKEADRILNRLKAEGGHSHEAGVLTDYLEFLTSLPWKKEEPVDIPLDKAEEALDADHFGLEKVKKRILEQIAVMKLRGEQSGSILLFVGAPGTGKTSIGQSIARALGREYVRISLGGARDEADIRGHRRTYVGAMPGRIMDGIEKAGVSNPVVVLDEVDKLGVSYAGDPSSALLEVLDPEQNSTFTDHYLNVPFDLSDVFFICTANTTETIPEPLLNRMELIRFQGYTPIEKREIAERHLLPRAKEAAGLSDGDLEISHKVVEEIIEKYTREAGVRGLKKQIDTLCRSAAVKLVRGEKTPIKVKTSELRAYLDQGPIIQKNVGKSAMPGVVTGLAWTPVGGDVLFIESTRMKGPGKLTITGQLGDVMKESAQIAMSLVRTLLPAAAKNLTDNDVHIHVPDGATPKDGPSAGITLTTALASLATGVPVPPTVAMTGEVSLQGTVNPIGGLPEKLMAAQRAGVKQVFIPAANVEDLRDVPDEVKDQLKIIPVTRAKDVLKKLSLI